jgi:hypothetical protein
VAGGPLCRFVRISILSWVATPPNPDVPCIRVALKYSQTDGLKGGSRFFFSYSGDAPTSTQCGTLASYISGTAWPDELGGLVNTDWSLTEVDVVDISSGMGASGTWTGTEAGTQSGTALPAQVAATIEYEIEDRYRGGKPRMYLPPGVTANLTNPSNWSSTFTTALSTSIVAFFNGIQTAGVVTADDLTHVNLSYYSGYATTTPPWRGPGFKYPPKYRTEALHSAVTGYLVRAGLSSQKRRRTATTY